MNSFYSEEELREIGFCKIGKHVQISRKASFYGVEKISLGNHVRIDDFCLLSGKITVGSYVHISAYAALYGGDAGIEMQDFSGLSSRSVIYAVTDDYSGKAMTNSTVPDKYRHVISEKVVVERHALIGSGCTVLPGVVVGEGTAVGSMALINKSLEGWGIYVGIPCRRIGERSRELLKYETELMGRH